MKWSTLRKIANVTFIQKMYIWIFIVPVLAKALSNIEDKVSVEIFKYKFELVTELPFYWSVFFYSALLFVIANLIYLWHCPNIIKENRSYQDFKAVGKTTVHLSSYSQEVGLSAGEINHEIEINKYNNEEYLQAADPASDDSGLKTKFWEIYAASDNFKSKYRKFASGCYIVAFILLGVVFGQNILAVIQHNIESFTEDTRIEKTADSQ